MILTEDVIPELARSLHIESTSKQISNNKNTAEQKNRNQIYTINGKKQIRKNNVMEYITNKSTY